MSDTLGSLIGTVIERIHTAARPQRDEVTLTFSDGRALVVPIDLVVPIGAEEWDDYWTDFDDFLEDGPDDVEPESIEGDVMTLGELLDRRVTGVRTGQGSGGGRYVVIDLDRGLGLLLPGTSAHLGRGRLSDCVDFSARLDAEVSRQVQEEPQS